MKDKKYLLYPVFFMIGVLLLDKIFLLDYFRDDFLQKGNPVFYSHRKILFQSMLDDSSVQNREKKLAIGLGDSRAYPFSNPGLPITEEGKWTIYNFSGPQAVPMYSLQWYERMIEYGIVPDLIFLSLSPEGFDDSKGLIYDPFMRLGMDSKFQHNYWDSIPWEDRYKYYLDILFSFRRIQFDFKLLWERLLSGNLSQYSPEMNEDMLVLKMGKGEYLAYAAVANVESKLKKDAQRIRTLYLNNYQVYDTQFYFVERLLGLAKEQGSKVFIVWPRVYKDYRAGYTELKLEETWWSKVVTLSSRYDAIPINYNDDKESGCDLFNDASHQSIYCFKEQMEDIFRRYREQE